MKVILASKSPRRRELLSVITKDFTVISPDVDETVGEYADVCDKICAVSLKKARAVLNLAEDGDVIIASDTAVVLDNKIYGKPKSEDDAFSMLSELSGKTHLVVTAFTVTDKKRTVTEAVVTKVTMRNLTESEIKNYIKTKEPLDKAGGYGIQGKGGLLIEKIDGDYYTVVGLPIARLSVVLKEFGIRSDI